MRYLVLEVPARNALHRLPQLDCGDADRARDQPGEDRAEHTTQEQDRPHPPLRINGQCLHLLQRQPRAFFLGRGDRFHGVGYRVAHISELRARCLSTRFLEPALARQLEYGGHVSPVGGVVPLERRQVRTVDVAEDTLVQLVQLSLQLRVLAFDLL